MMECPRGSVCSESTHEVKTLDKALEWYPSALAIHLPITVNTHKAQGGRLLIKVYSIDGLLLHKRG